jgi:hypothetical protein
MQKKTIADHWQNLNDLVRESMIETLKPRAELETQDIPRNILSPFCYNPFSRLPYPHLVWHEEKELINISARSLVLGIDTLVCPLDDVDTLRPVFIDNTVTLYLLLGNNTLEDSVIGFSGKKNVRQYAFYYELGNPHFIDPLFLHGAFALLAQGHFLDFTERIAWAVESSLVHEESARHQATLG